MSGTYIPDFEPSKEEYISFIYPDGTVVKPKYEEPCYEIYKAIPVPAHGRLIDADAFCEKILEIVERQKYDDFYAKSFSVGAILREVVNELRGVGLDGFDNAPTIIPADKEGEG